MERENVNWDMLSRRWGLIFVVVIVIGLVFVIPFVIVIVTEDLKSLCLGKRECKWGGCWQEEGW